MSRAPQLPPSIPGSLHDETRALGQRFIAACESADPALCAADLDEILEAFAASPFIAGFAVREPRVFLDTIRSADIEHPRGRDDFGAMIADALAAAGSTDEVTASLRRIRVREFCRIAWRDIRLGADVETVMAELSDFADAVLGQAVDWLEAQLEPRFGRAVNAAGEPLKLLVLGMGKLGGRELNFSSDVDLVFVYECRGRTTGGRKELDHQDYFDRLGRDLIALLNEMTADGFVFRVDMRLRPFGEAGPLCSSLSALEQYYTVHGRDWERYALIKARAIRGDHRCRDALERIVRPFVFRRYLDYGALDALREMKALINRESRSDPGAYDVKRGDGGIREIEFIGQLFQLTRGGRETRLRQRSLLRTLATCGELGLLDLEAVSELSAAYRFLRATEHRLQQVADRQTHALPRDEVGRARLAYALRYETWQHFSEDLDRHRQTTGRYFAGLLRLPVQTDDRGGPGIVAWRDLWFGPDDEEPMVELATQAGFVPPDPYLETLRKLKSPRFLSRLSGQGRNRLDRLMPKLLEHVARKKMSAATFGRLGNLVMAIARRSVYVAFLTENPDALLRLVELFGASPWIADRIIAHPSLLDELLDPRVLFAPPDRSQLRKIVGERVAAADDLEGEMEAIRSFKNQQALRVAASDITGQFPVAEVSNQLTYIAEASIAAALQIAWQNITARHGEPHCLDGGQRRPAGFGVIGYGKLGGWELGYGSDLDLVFLHDSRGERQQTDGPKPIENGVFFTRLAQRLIHVLSTTTAAGSAYEIDVRLRPSGASGLLVAGTDAFDAYQREEAWVWEHQALVRARAVAGGDNIVRAFEGIRAHVLAMPRDARELKSKIVEMRDRMQGEIDRTRDGLFDLKHGTGGITDIEFMVQYAVLRWACEHPPLLAWTDNLRLLETIADLGLMPAADCRRLHDAYFAYRADIHRCALQQLDSLVDEGAFHQHRNTVTEIWNAAFA